ncbi:MAG: DUF3326 domain-containing protein [Cyanobium sp.]
MSDTPALPTLLVIPTGIGCDLGGYAGDGLPAARLLAAASGCLITHPNVMNAASLYWSDRRIHYVEGWALDRFAAGELALAPRPAQTVGVLLDAGIEPELLLRHRQVIDACRASLGLPIGPVLQTDAPLEVSLQLGESGSSWGTLAHPDALLRAGERLVEAGATAIAVVARFPDDPDSEALASYRAGSGVDALAGAEAVISHLLVRHLGIPCAHAPALEPLPLDPQLDPRAAAEELGHTFLPCVLVGLSRAPDLIPLAEPRLQQPMQHEPWPTPMAVTGEPPDGTARRLPGAAAAPSRRAPASRHAAAAAWSAPGLLHASQLGAVVAPAGALGGAAVLSCAALGIPLIAVDNPCLLEVTAESLGLRAIPARSYSEAAGLVLALREGIDPAALVRPLAERA